MESCKCFLELQCLRTFYILQNKVEGQLLFTNEGQFMQLTVSFQLFSITKQGNALLFSKHTYKFHSNTSELLPEKEATTTWANVPKQYSLS